MWNHKDMLQRKKYLLGFGKYAGHENDYDSHVRVWEQGVRDEVN